MRIPFIAGNWKMFKTQEEAKAFACEETEDQRRTKVIRLSGGIKV